MRIAMLARIFFDEHGEKKYYFTADGQKMIVDSGHVPYFVSSISEIDFVLENCDMLFVPGGVDVDPALYGECVNGAVFMNEETDKLDFAYIDAFYKANKPILGICRGQQVINVFFGGSLYQDISGHRDNVKHSLKVEDFVEDIYKSTIIETNSFHHQAVKDVADGFKVVALADDGTIEALRNNNIYTVQWHPEMMDGKAFLQGLLTYISK